MPTAYPAAKAPVTEAAAVTTAPPVAIAAISSVPETTVDALPTPDVTFPYFTSCARSIAEDTVPKTPATFPAAPKTFPATFPALLSATAVTKFLALASLDVAVSALTAADSIFDAADSIFFSKLAFLMILPVSVSTASLSPNKCPSDSKMALAPCLEMAPVGWTECARS